MRRNWTQSIVPNGNNYGQVGTAFAETDVGEADLEPLSPT
jgi:hypothetical protein